ncbi:MAG TPA: DUF3455 domain-containing protein [Candidatus Polarisedimenticolaceae bacterium]
MKHQAHSPIVAAVTAVLILASSAPARADRVTPPPVPGAIQVPEENRAFLAGHAVGTQNYICLPSGAAFAWVLFTPQATLFADEDRQLTTHFFSPNPFENDLVRPAWQHSRDTSIVWGRLYVPASSDPDFVAPGAIPWLLLKAAGAGAGPGGGDALTRTTFIHRVHTSGGVAPATGCSSSTDVGAKASVPYEADYYFYSAEDEAGE